MIGNIGKFPIELNFRIGYFLHDLVLNSLKKLDIDLRSATIGFVSALMCCSFLSPNVVATVSRYYGLHHHVSLYQWLAWIIIGLSLCLFTQQMTAQKIVGPPIYPPFSHPKHHRSNKALERANQQLWQVLQKQSIDKQHLQATNQRLLHLATTDGLTQVKNRYFFDREIHHEWARSQREDQPLSLILFDVDYFKQYNDCYGHQAGDSCLQKIAQIAQQSIYRPADFVARYGGEEFAIVLPNTTQKGAIAIAQRIQADLQALAIPHLQSDISNIISLSLGIATTIPTEHTSCEDLIALADQSLYRAKRNGRDRYVVAGERKKA